MTRQTREDPSSGGYLVGEGRAGELSHLVNECLLGVKRIWLYEHQRGPTAQADDSSRRLTLALVIGAALSSFTADTVRAGPLQDMSSRIPTTLRLSLAREDPHIATTLATVAKKLATPE